MIHYDKINRILRQYLAIFSIFEIKIHFEKSQKYHWKNNSIMMQTDEKERKKSRESPY